MTHMGPVGEEVQAGAWSHHTQHVAGWVRINESDGEGRYGLEGVK
jgi:hypothetical protein